MFVPKGKVGKLQCFHQLVHLSFEASCWPAVGDFLQESNGRILLANELDDSLQTVAAIDATDSLMNVPRQDSQLHFPQSSPFAIYSRHRCGAGDEAPF